MTWLCYTDCDSGQRYAAHVSQCIISFDRAVIKAVMENLEFLAQTAAADGAMVANDVEQTSPQTANHIREESKHVASSAARALRRSRLLAEAFLITNGQRMLVRSVKTLDTFHHVRQYTAGDPSTRTGFDTPTAADPA